MVIGVGLEVWGVWGLGFEVVFGSFSVMRTERVCLFCLCVCLYAGLCMYVCSLITRERDGRLSPHFQVNSRVSQGWF